MAELVAATIAIAAGLFITLMLFTHTNDIPDKQDGIRLVYLTGAGWYHHYNTEPTTAVVGGPYRSKKTAYKAAVKIRNGDTQ